MASNHAFKSPYLAGSNLFLLSRELPAFGQPLTHMETEKLLSPSKTSSFPPVGTTANTPLDKSRDFPLPVGLSLANGSRSS